MGTNGRRHLGSPSAPANGSTGPLRSMFRDCGLMPVDIIPTPFSAYWGQVDYGGEVGVRVMLTMQTPSGVQGYAFEPADAVTAGRALMQLGAMGDILIATNPLPPEAAS